MDSKRNLYKVLNKDQSAIYVIADSPTQAMQLAALPRPEQEAHINTQEAVAVFAQDAVKNVTLQQLLDTGEIGEVSFDPYGARWTWVAPFYLLEFKYHGPFNSNETAAQFAVNSKLPETSRVLRMQK
jgi:hypothetical protein